MFLSDTQQEKIVDELQYLSVRFPIVVDIILDIKTKGADSEYLESTDASYQQICIKIDEDTFVYSEQALFGYSALQHSDKDVLLYKTETMEFSDYEDDIESIVSGYYTNLDEVKEIYAENWKQIALECAFEQMEIDHDFSLQSAINSLKFNKPHSPEIG